MSHRDLPLKAACLLMALALCGCMTADRKFQRGISALQRDSLVHVGSDAELNGFRQRLSAVHEARRLAELKVLCQGKETLTSMPWQCADYFGIDTGDSSTLDTVTVTGSRINPGDIITNNQVAGVDEGDIVKKSGDFVLVLREGVLYSLRILRDGKAVLELSDRLNVAVERESESVWYDEILTAGSRAIVLAYNYGDDVAELHVFGLDARGKLSRESRFWLRTGDYFSSSNYGARLQGDNLLISLSLPLKLEGEMQWPEWSRRDAASPRWTALVEASELIYPVLLDADPYVHVVMQCPLAGLADEALKCRSTGIIGNASSIIFASPTHAYLAMDGWDRAAFGDPAFYLSDRENLEAQARLAKYRRTAILRVPYDRGRAVDFALVGGRVNNPFQLHQADDGSLFVAARRGDYGRGGLELVRISPDRFSGKSAAPQTALVAIAPSEFESTLRFSAKALWLGDELAEGSRVSRLRRQPLDGSALQGVDLPQSSEMLQPAFGQMLSVGADASEGLAFAMVTDTDAPRLLSSLAIPDYDAAESRSHALNFARLPGGAALIGLPGLPLPVDPRARYEERASDMVYVNWQEGRLRSAGILEMRGAPEPDDYYCSQCVDWYGNARTFFIGSRVFALSSNRMREARFDGRQVVGVRDVALP